jgi:demethylmenaquinone methyltransferase/2-methoxy-6-polyprenyl-1,4-benzoquinol methylase
LYLRQVVVPAARSFGLEQHYAYLESSLARFPTAPELVELARLAGFGSVRHQPLAAGLMGLLDLRT